MKIAVRLFWLVWFFVAIALTQSTQGLITGRVISSRNGVPLAGAEVTYSNLSTGVGSVAHANSDGVYYLPLLSPGTYKLRVEAKEFQAQELYDLVLPVAARLELDFA